MSVDHGQLRIGWMSHGGWGRASLVYGPMHHLDGLVFVVSGLNCLMTSQTDPRPEGRRAMLGRWRATLPRGPLRRPVLKDNLVIGWFAEAVPRRRPVPLAAVVHRAGENQTGELWFEAGSQRLRLCEDLQNLPATYAVAIEDGAAVLYAWSYPGAVGFADPDQCEALARIELEDPVPPAAYAAIHQAILGEVHYRVDTRVQEVEVLRCTEGVSSVIPGLNAHRWWEPEVGSESITDDFSGPAGDLDATSTSDGNAEWARVFGEGVIQRDGEGAAEVRASVTDPNPGRTVYCVPWDPTDGVEVSALVIPPGTGRGEGHQGRSGLVVWQDADNHLVVNHFIDDGSIGVSISAFLRTGGQETMFEWDAVWSNVGTRVQWGQPFRLSVACDGYRFLCRIGEEPVLFRELSDYRSDAQPLRITGVGLVPNWEWGDDTGTRFGEFSVRALESATRSS